MTNNNTQAVIATAVSDSQRPAFLPKHVGGGMAMIEFESRVFGHLEAMSKQYRGGYWEFFELSNEGFYLAPRMDNYLTIRVEGNGFEGAMSADAAGIVATLFTLSSMSFKYVDKPVGDRCADNYHRLRDFAIGHREARKIFGAID